PNNNEVSVDAVTTEKDGPIYHLRGNARVETADMLLKADELDYNTDTDEVVARGHVHFEHFARGEKVDCDRGNYNTQTQKGTFYNVPGSSPVRVQSRPGLLTTQNPFYFHAEWAEREQNRYILHNGYLTDCLVPGPWWILRAPQFDVIPGDYAIAHRSWFYLRKIPLFYSPYFYKSLKKQPRRSGFL